MTSPENKIATEPSKKTFRSPYPGLKPFQEEDLEYFFGRTTQIADIVERLETSRFVTVIGGSGSGKSSLVLAGVIPLLRTSSLRRNFAFREAGNFWVSVITTPGTNHGSDDSPIRRLARKFCGLLNPVPSSSPDSSNSEEARLDHCVELLRKPNGLNEMVKAYGRQLKDNGGVDLSQKIPSEDSSGEARFLVNINFLFLIDQFEELFHPSNDNNAEVKKDCEHLVNRIFDQFNDKDKCLQICVALTMRSEHLDDCQRYLGLPGAINKTFYLVNQLSHKEIEEAIRKPAQRFLQQQFMEAYRRAEDAGSEDLDDLEDTWPAEIPFDKNLVKQILEDVDKVRAKAEHADHLPLLQHLLFWTWQCATQRNKGKPVPDAVTLSDLREAAYADFPKGEESNPNMLTACLDYRCEMIFRGHEDKQKDWEEVFRNLAFKEPNTGYYTQKRASHDNLQKCLSGGLPKDQTLQGYLSPWLEPHGYLYWDEDSATVKVAHESLIRRWNSFRKWVDDDERKFQAYMKLLEECLPWQDNPCDANLSIGPTLQRFVDYNLSDALKNENLCSRFGELLQLDRDGGRLQDAVEDAQIFLQKSEEKEKNDEYEKLQSQQRMADQKAETELANARAEKATAEQARAKAESVLSKRTARFLWGICIVVVIFLVVSILDWQMEKKNRQFLTVYAIAAETQDAVTSQLWFNTWDGPKLPLSYLSKAIKAENDYIQKYKLLESFKQITNILSGDKPNISDYIKLGAEIRTIDSLHSVLLNNAWTLPKSYNVTLSTDNDAKPTDCDYIEAETQPPPLDIGPLAPMSEGSLDAKLVGETPSLRGGSAQSKPLQKPVAKFYPRKEMGFEQYGLMVKKVNKDAPAMTISWGHIENEKGKNNCRLIKKIITADTDSSIGFASDLSEIIITKTNQPNKNQPSEFYPLSWPLEISSYEKPDLFKIYKSKSPIIEAIKPDKTDKKEVWPILLNTKSQKFIHDVKIGETWYRLFEPYPHPNKDFDGKGGTEVNNNPDGMACKNIKKMNQSESIESIAFVDLTFLEDGVSQIFCLRIFKQEQFPFYYGELYRINHSNDENPIPLITNLYFGERPPKRVAMDKDTIRFISGTTWFEQPWSFNALLELENGVDKPNSEPKDTPDSGPFKGVKVWVEELNKDD